jgi:hypothetical protein
LNHRNTDIPTSNTIEVPILNQIQIEVHLLTKNKNTTHPSTF